MEKLCNRKYSSRGRRQQRQGLQASSPQQPNKLCGCVRSVALRGAFNYVSTYQQGTCLLAVCQSDVVQDRTELNVLGGEDFKRCLGITNNTQDRDSSGSLMQTSIDNTRHELIRCVQQVEGFKRYPRKIVKGLRSFNAVTGWMRREPRSIIGAAIQSQYTGSREQLSAKNAS